MKVETPHHGEKLGLRQHETAVVAEGQEQGELDRCQLDGATAALDRMRALVDDQVTQLDDCRAVTVTAHQRGGLASELGQQERLGHHLVGTCSEPDQPVLQLRRWTEHHEWDVGDHPHPVDDRPLVKSLALGIDHHQVRPEFGEQPFRRPPRRGLLDRMVVVAERMHNRVGKEFVVAHDENPRDTHHLYARPSASSQTGLPDLGFVHRFKIAVVPVP
jgi:hypothetical protein